MSLFARTTLVLSSLLSVPALAADSQKVHHYTLDNGLKLLVREDHRAPVVVSQVWYKVGSSYESNGVTGLSHVLEHMMFQGTENYGPGEFSRIIAENGGRENAFTGQDYTAYYQHLEKSRLPVSFRMEADRMRHLKLADKEFDKELQVVIEERRMRTDDQPRSKTYEYFMAMAYSNGPYKNPVIGWPADLDSMQLGDLKAWYQRWYAPNNATVVVAGDVQPEAVLALAKEHFGKLEAEEFEPLKPRTEVPQLGERRMQVKLPAKLPYVLMGYKVPSLKTAQDESEVYALEMLARILDGGSSARLTSRLIRGSQLALSAGAGYDLYERMSTLFMMDGTPSEGHSPQELEQALRDEIERFKTEPVSAEELARVKAQVKADAIYERDSVFYQAMQVGKLETVGLSWKKMDEYVDRINQVTAEQIQQVASKYLIDDHLSVAYLDPQPIDEQQAARQQAASRGGQHGH